MIVLTTSRFISSRALIYVLEHPHDTIMRKNEVDPPPTLMCWVPSGIRRPTMESSLSTCVMYKHTYMCSPRNGKIATKWLAGFKSEVARWVRRWSENTPELCSICAILYLSGSKNLNSIWQTDKQIIWILVWDKEAPDQ